MEGFNRCVSRAPRPPGGRGGASLGPSVARRDRSRRRAQWPFSSSARRRGRLLAPIDSATRRAPRRRDDDDVALVPRWWVGEERNARPPDAPRETTHRFALLLPALSTVVVPPPSFFCWRPLPFRSSRRALVLLATPSFPFLPPGARSSAGDPFRSSPPAGRSVLARRGSVEERGIIPRAIEQVQSPWGQSRGRVSSSCVRIGPPEHRAVPTNRRGARDRACGLPEMTCVSVVVCGRMDRASEAPPLRDGSTHHRRGARDRQTF